MHHEAILLSDLSRTFIYDVIHNNRKRKFILHIAADIYRLRSKEKSFKRFFKSWRVPLPLHAVNILKR